MDITPNRAFVKAARCAKCSLIEAHRGVAGRTIGSHRNDLYRATLGLREHQIPTDHAASEGNA